MATPAILQRLQSRAAQAETIMNQLHAQLDVIRKTAVENACKEEEARLRVENNKLRQDVDNLRKYLVQVEIRNGVKHVPMPVRGVAPVSPAVAPPAQAAVSMSSSSPPDASGEPPKKQAKKEKKGGDGKVKNQQPEGPVMPVDVSRLDMRVGHIVSAKKHPDADGLYVEDVNLGEERNRVIISGLVNNIPLEQMQDRLAIFLTNLKPAKMRGILSEGMIMCASTPEKVEIIDPPEGAAIGDRITVEAFTGEPDKMLNPKKKVWEAVLPDLMINDAGLATYKGELWTIAAKGNCKAPTLKKVSIK